MADPGLELMGGGGGGGGAVGGRPPMGDADLLVPFPRSAHATNNCFNVKLVLKSKAYDHS